MAWRPRLALAYSTGDPVGSGVAARLRHIVGAERAECPRAVECFLLRTGQLLAGFRERQTELEFLDETPDPAAEAVIVLSRHASQSGRPTLTTHHTGNPAPGEPLLGGRPGELSISAPPLSKLLLATYREEAEARGLLERYEISLEATHHGPTSTGKPLVFIEIGSTPKEWGDPDAQEAMASAVARSLEAPLPECRRAAGFGGTHYPRKFTRLHLETDVCMGHIIPKYAFQKGAGEDAVRQAILKTWPGPAEVAVYEKKSLRAEYRDMVKRVVEALGVPLERV